MGRSRWLCYGMNADRRRQEEMERRPGIRPKGDERGDREPQGAWPEGLPMETFSQCWVQGRGWAILTPRPYLQIHHGLVHPRPLWGAAVSFGQVTHGPGVDHFRFHIPGPTRSGTSQLWDKDKSPETSPCRSPVLSTPSPYTNSGRKC